jgi:hypothetical protein
MLPMSRTIALQILERFSLKPRWTPLAGNTGQLIFEGEEQAHLFIALVKPHVPECMQHKLSFGFQGPHYQVRQALTKELLQGLATQGIPIKRMARELNQSATTISRYLEAYGIEHPRVVGHPRKSP